MEIDIINASLTLLPSLWIPPTPHCNYNGEITLKSDLVVTFNRGPNDLPEIDGFELLDDLFGDKNYI